MRFDSALPTHSAEAQRWIPWILLAALASILFLTGCNNEQEDPPGPTADTRTQELATALLEPGDARFLMGRRNLIQSITLSGEETDLVTLEKPLSVAQIAVSQDRKRMVFVVEVPAVANGQGALDFGSDLYMSDIDGGNLRELLKHGTVGDYFEAPIWLDDSTIMFGWRGFDASGSTIRIERLDVESGEREVVMDGAAMGTLSPDRKSLIYSEVDPVTRAQQLMIREVAGKEAPRVLVDETQGLAFFFSLAFSPDGSQLAFAALDAKTAVAPARKSSFGLASARVHPSLQDVWLVNPADGSGLHRVADLAESLPSVSWSGDGTHLYVLGMFYLWRIDLATGEAEQLRENGIRAALVWLDGS